MNVFTEVEITTPATRRHSGKSALTSLSEKSRHHSKADNGQHDSDYQLNRLKGNLFQDPAPDKRAQKCGQRGCQEQITH